MPARLSRLERNPATESGVADGEFAREPGDLREPTANDSTRAGQRRSCATRGGTSGRRRVTEERVCAAEHLADLLHDGTDRHVSSIESANPWF